MSMMRSRALNAVWTFGSISFVILKNGLTRKLARRTLLFRQKKRQKERIAWR